MFNYFGKTHSKKYPKIEIPKRVNEKLCLVISPTMLLPPHTPTQILSKSDPLLAFSKIRKSMKLYDTDIRQSRFVSTEEFAIWLTLNDMSYFSSIRYTIRHDSIRVSCCRCLRKIHYHMNCIKASFIQPKISSKLQIVWNRQIRKYF